MRQPLLVTLICLTGMAGSFTATKSFSAMSIEAGASLQQFDYREFDIQGERLLREHGQVPGLSLNIRHNTQALTSLLYLQFNQNTVQYDGQKQTGQALSSKTKERISNIEISFQPKLAKSGNLEAGPHLGLGFREWQRDIQATATTTSLAETYRWVYHFIGVSANWRMKEHWSLGISAEAFSAINPHIEVHAPGYDTTTLHLNPQPSYRLKLPITYRTKSNNNWRITPYWQSWNMGRSNTKPLRINGTPSGLLITEPESKTQILGISVSRDL